MEITEGSRAFGNTPELQPEMDEGGETQATEEEQQHYDMLVTRAMKIMHGEGKDDILAMLSSAESPAQSMGQVAASILKTMAGAAKEQGTDIGPDVIQSAGLEVIELLSELGQAGGIFQYESEDEETSQIDDAMLWGVKYYGDAMQASNELTPELQAAAEQAVSEGLAAEQGGRPQGSAQPQPMARPATRTPGSDQPQSNGIINQSVQNGSGASY